MKVYDAQGDSSFLNAEFYNIKVSGTTDFYISSEDAFDNSLPLANCPLVIKLPPTTC
jgi:hypothetical protein